jgi:ribosomal protein L4
MKLKVANGGAELAVSDENFGREFNQALVFQVVNAYMAAGRSGTKAQKTRAEVRGGGRTPRRVPARHAPARFAAPSGWAADAPLPPSRAISRRR